MTIQELRKIATERGVDVPRCISKVELVRLMQRTEGNPECFATKRRTECPEINCLWRDDCAKLHVPDAVCGENSPMPGFWPKGH